MGGARSRKVRLMKFPRDPLLDHCIAYVPCGPAILHELVPVTEISRKHRITGSLSAVWRFFNRHKVTSKKEPVRDRNRISLAGRGPGASELDATARLRPAE
jgi:hypothetical protein